MALKSLVPSPSGTHWIATPSGGCRRRVAQVERDGERTELFDRGHRILGDKTGLPVSR
jgi:hypothetical protein